MGKLLKYNAALHHRREIVWSDSIIYPNSNEPWIYNSRFNSVWSYSDFAECSYATDKNISGTYFILP
ncbi:hypothetical protein D3C77_554960 [compost metagenome]